MALVFSPSLIFFLPLICPGLLISFWHILTRHDLTDLMVPCVSHCISLIITKSTGKHCIPWIEACIMTVLVAGQCSVTLVMQVFSSFWLVHSCGSCILIKVLQCAELWAMEAHCKSTVQGVSLQPCTQRSRSCTGRCEKSTLRLLGKRRIQNKFE